VLAFILDIVQYDSKIDDNMLSSSSITYSGLCLFIFIKYFLNYWR
jgi:hypothetical protein